MLNRAYLVYFPLALGVALAETLSSSLTIEMILARMAKARDENKALMRPYTLTRNYKLFAKGNNQAKSEVTAEVTFVPPAKNLQNRALEWHELGREDRSENVRRRNSNRRAIGSK